MFRTSGIIIIDDCSVSLSPVCAHEIIHLSPESLIFVVPIPPSVGVETAILGSYKPLVPFSKLGPTLLSVKYKGNPLPTPQVTQSHGGQTSLL